MDHTDNQNLLKILKQEILELKKKNLILENQNSEILSLYDKTADPSLILDSTGCLLGFNQVLLDTYGYDRKQLLHNHIAILHAQPENRDKINTTIQNPSDDPPMNTSINDKMEVFSQLKFMSVKGISRESLSVLSPLKISPNREQPSQHCLKVKNASSWPLNHPRLEKPFQWPKDDFYG